MESDTRQKLIGKHYIDQDDSGDVVMEIVGLDALVPSDVIVLHPDGRCWQRNWTGLVVRIIEEV
jgi:hypothetical protein